ncbi:hypothetical protein MHYP_G00036210 [Metynnis hypsauchen]
MNKPKNPSEGKSSGAPRKSSHAKGRRHKKETQNINEDERELQALRLTFHQLTEARRAQERKAQETLRKQSQLIGYLKAERQGLQAELKRVGHALGTESFLSQSFNALYHHSVLIDESITQEKQIVSGLQKEIREMHRKIDKERRTAAFEANPNRKIRRFTGQLAQVNKSFSTLISTNAQLRHDVETMRGEKAKFLQIRSKLEKALQETHLQKGRVLQQATESTLIREDTRARTLRVLEQSCSEEDTHAVEVQELQRQLGHVKKSEHFLQEKNKTRQPDLNYCFTAERKEAHEQELQVEKEVKLKEYEIALEKISDIIQKRERGQQRRWKNSEHSTDTVMEPPQCGFWESARRRRSTMVGPMFREAAAGLWVETEGVRRGRRLIEHRRRSTLPQCLKPEEKERLRHLSFSVLEQNSQQPAAGLNPQLLCDSYMKGEDLNFSLFSYISEQNRQIEAMTKDVHELRKIMKQEEERGSAEECLLQNKVRELRLSCQQATQTAETIQKDVGGKESILRLLTAGPEYPATNLGVESLAAQTGMDVSLFELRPGPEDSGIRAMLNLLRQIEQRVTQLLAIHSYTQYRESKGGKLDFAPVVLKKADPRKLPDTDIELPVISSFPESEEEYDDEEMKPLSAEELQKRALELVLSLHT